MLIPIGQENSTVRRQPWVSYAVIGANLLVFLVLAVAFDEDAYMQAASAKWEAAARYLAEHPYLETPTQIARYVDHDFAGELEAERERLSSQAEIPEGVTRAGEQRRLQELAGEFAAAQDQAPFRRLGYIPAKGGAWTLVTNLFVHAGFFHLFFNMLFFLLSGPFIEDVFGRPIFAALYFLAGFAATLAHAFKFPTSDIPTVGASGAIAGVMGAFLIRLGASRIRFLWIPLFPFVLRFRFTFFMPAFVVLPFWFAQQLFYGLSGDESGVGWWAHIGGFVFGAAFAGTVRLAGVEARFVNPAIEKQISLVQHPGLEAALEARTRGEWELARAEIQKALSAEPQNVDAWIEAYEIAVASGDRPEAGRLAQRLLELHQRHGERSLADGLIRDAVDRVGDTLPPRFFVAAAGFLEKEGDARSALELYERAARIAPSDPAALRALFRCGEILCKGGNLRDGRAAFDRARAHPGWNEQLRQAADQAIAKAEGGKR